MLLEDPDKSDALRRKSDEVSRVVIKLLFEKFDSILYLYIHFMY
jgi:hypothetical protein